MAKISTVAIIEAVRLKEMTTTPDTTGAGYSAIYAQSDGLYFVDDDKNETGPLVDASGAGDMNNPMTTIGDIIYATTSGVPTRLAAGTEDYVLTMGAEIPEWAAAGAGGSGLYSAYICIQDQKAQNTAGGTFTTGSWQTRDLTTEVADTGSHASLSSNQITLAAGTYRCIITCPAFRVGKHQACLYDVTNTAILLYGSSLQNNTTAAPGDVSIIVGRFTLAGSTVLEVQHQGANTFATSGFGEEANFGTEIYTSAEFWKEA